jgi:hypothetical protein
MCPWSYVVGREITLAIRRISPIWFLALPLFVFEIASILQVTRSQSTEKVEKYIYIYIYCLNKYV